MSQAILTDTSQFDALDATGAVKPPEPEPVSSASPAPASQTSSASGDSTASDELDGEIAEDSTEDDEDPNDSRIFIRRKDGKFAPHAKKKIVGELKGRVSKLTAKYRDAEAELSRLRSAGAPAPPASAAQVSDAKATTGPGKPSFDQFKDDPDPLNAWVEAVAEWKAEQAFSKRDAAAAESRQREASAQGQAALAERVQAFVKEHDDFQTVVQNPSLLVSASIRRVLETHDLGPEMAYYLGTHLDAARELALLTQHTPADSSGVALVGELLSTRMGAGQLPGAASSVGRSSAPRPLTPVRTGGGAREDGPDADVPFEQFFERENAKERKRQRR